MDNINNMNIIEQMLEKYTIKTEDDFMNAVKEAFQEIALLGLYRAGFFEKACFYGGTALRLFYGLDRFSEDLDFSLLQNDEKFDIEKYFPKIINEFKALDVDIVVSKKIKQRETGIETAFLKTDAELRSLSIKNSRFPESLKNIRYGQKIKIKIEVDTNPPLKFTTESKTLLLPITFHIISMTLPDLYAGKMHAVLFRSWGSRVKGRDWYDFEWYVKKGAELNLEHLKERMIMSGKWKKKDNFDADIFKNLMMIKIESLDIQSAKKEVKPFIRNPDVLNSWSKEYFKTLTGLVRFKYDRK